MFKKKKVQSQSRQILLTEVDVSFLYKQITMWLLNVEFDVALSLKL